LGILIKVTAGFRPIPAVDLDFTEQPNPTGRDDDRLNRLDHGIPPQVFYQGRDSQMSRFGP
jgi:hypothetical protein